MSIFCEFKKVNQDRSIFISASHVVIISHGAERGTTTIELAGQRSFDVQGRLEDTMQALEL
jgi:hypothetical protein